MMVTLEKFSLLSIQHPSEQDMVYGFGMFAFIIPAPSKLRLVHSLLPGVGCRVGDREGPDALQVMFSNN